MSLTGRTGRCPGARRRERSGHCEDVEVLCTTARMSWLTTGSTLRRPRRPQLWRRSSLHDEEGQRTNALPCRQQQDGSSLLSVTVARLRTESTENCSRFGCIYHCSCTCTQPSSTGSGMVPLHMRPASATSYRNGRTSSSSRNALSNTSHRRVAGQSNSTAICSEER